MAAKVILDHWDTLVVKVIVEVKVTQAVKVTPVAKVTREIKELVLGC